MGMGGKRVLEEPLPGMPWAIELDPSWEAGLPLLCSPVGGFLKQTSFTLAVLCGLSPSLTKQMQGKQNPEQGLQGHKGPVLVPGALGQNGNRN